MIRTIDSVWLSAHPLPGIGAGLDKEARGQVLVVGGSRTVAGAVLLTGEAALRVGAGKVQIASIEHNIQALAIAFPECAVIGLPTTSEGEIGSTTRLLERSTAKSDVVLVGPGMSYGNATAQLLIDLANAARSGSCLLLDAAAIQACADGLSPRPDVHCIVTPHAGEMARLLDISRDEIEKQPERYAREAAERFDAIVVLKSSTTVIADRGGDMLSFQSPAPGLGTAGSGDVLAGTIAGLVARGTAPLDAAAWGVWLHGQAGRRLGERMGTVGYLARELLTELPALVSASPDI